MNRSEDIRTFTTHNDRCVMCGKKREGEFEHNNTIIICADCMKGYYDGKKSNE